MLRQVRGGRVLPGTPPKMINRPTIMPIAGVEGQGLPIQETDPFFSIEIDASAATETEEAILFDGGGGYQLGLNQTSGPNLEIRGLSADYQFILNDVVHNASFVSTMKMHVVPTDGSAAEAISLVQWSHPLYIYTSSKGSKPRLLKTVHPTMGVNEQQYHFNINTFPINLLVDNRIALVFKVEPKTRLVLGFYQQAELNRVQ